MELGDRILKLVLSQWNDLEKLAGTHNQNFFTSLIDEYTIDPQHSFHMVKTTSVAL